MIFVIRISFYYFFFSNNFFICFYLIDLYKFSLFIEIVFDVKVKIGIFNIKDMVKK